MRPFLLLIAACADQEPTLPSAELVFVRDAVLAPADVGGQPLPDGRVLVDMDWQPGQEVTLGGARASLPAPQNA